MVSVQGTIFGFRTDDPFSRNSYDNWLRMDTVAAMLNQRIAWIEDGTLRARPVGEHQICGLLVRSDRGAAYPVP